MMKARHASDHSIPLEGNDSRDTRDREERDKDPQHTVTGRLRRGQTSDLITFKIHIYYLEMTFIVTVPEEGTTEAPVYIKFRLSNTRSSGF